MIIIRPIKREDIELLGEFSFESLLGFTNLPRNRDKLLEKIIHSESSFSKNIEKPGDEEYFFVLEDLTTGRIGGTSAILAQSLLSSQHCYQIATVPNPVKHVTAIKDIKVLKIIENIPDSSEICALYLYPSFRHSGQGRLLSLSRFLFIANHKKRFKKKFLAELRGYIDQTQVSPFWEGIGRHFCDLSFVELMAQIEIDQRLAPQILPEFPIYIPLLPKETQEAIGKTHDSSKPAYKMLMQENFSFNQEVDIFEGGPILTANTDEIRTIQKSASLLVELTREKLSDETEYILANEKLDFRACYGNLQMVTETSGLINEEVAHALCVKNGDRIRFISPHEKSQ